MAKEFDQPNIYDAFVSHETLTDKQKTWVSNFFQSITEYLSAYGIFLPKLTTDQRDSIQSPIDGQMIYNTDSHEFQGYQNGVWKNLIYTPSSDQNLYATHMTTAQRDALINPPNGMIIYNTDFNISGNIGWIQGRVQNAWYTVLIA